jgi:ribosomal protein S18 acetylase RimI-like enzyme
LPPQLRRLALPVDEQLSAALADFNCLGDRHEGDPVAENVNGFLSEGRYLPGLEHGISSTYLFIDPEKAPLLVGYATLTFDSIRLTNAEKRQMEELVGIAEFGALRIQMIGIDHRHQGTHCGTALLEAITGLARKVSQDVAVRFLLADANIRKVKWYEAHGFVANRAKVERERPDPTRSVSMRLDLLDALRGKEAGEASLAAAGRSL